MDLGRFGIWTFDFEGRPAGAVRDSVQELEELGWRAIWIPELHGREALTHAAYLLSCTQRISVVNGIAQIWAREPRWTHGAAALLADAYPDRHVLGLGVGGARPGIKPLQAMHEYLDSLDDALATTTSVDPAPQAPIRRLLAAYGPKMLAMARDRASGAHTYHVTHAHTAQAREVLGAHPFLGVEHAVLFESDPSRAREIAREHLHPYFTQTYNIAKFLRLGYTDADIDGGRGSDRLVDDLVFWGDLDTIVGKLHQHLDAGADHVGIQVIGVEPGETAMPRWRRLAEALSPTTNGTPVGT
ncbi:TIGR03620 family F420-dependent LLM class oxidoreductase [Pseudonocardia sp. MH-G8]|uniref:TIGR03620 family F420-dependent LLM class oxidoreductase n=1 Tax=Pseudonocardia sp. MH-G8 TaxID=1854588 RepID=UPI000BA0396B|nr:TIGR03620 family F420-dependent LLM class oxidoreductase [Pseudonocardia sp. MH-G8]OZM82475.1 LLM class F420-dependent oxidoreductase [Pseudonocardia sp. MH-G8]